MRILLVNAFHYLKGGVERTYLDESRWLRAAGHDVAHLAIHDSRNLESPTSARFAPAADYGEGAPALKQLALLPRVIWSAPAARSMESVVEEFEPDVAHLHAPSRYLTPSVLRPLERAKIPTVMTLHDFKPWCTNRILFAHGRPCERCKGGEHWHAFAVGCVQDSHIKSAIGTIEAYTHQAMHAYRHVKKWIAPSQFVNDKAIEFGVPANQLRVLPHGVEAPMREPGGEVESDDEPVSSEPSPAKGPYVLFSGRLSIEKGVLLLPGIAKAIAPTPLLIAGEGPLASMLKRAQSSDAPNLRVLGHLADSVLAEHRRHAAAVVVPSLFYEHFCYAAAEALLDERPVVAARIGAIPELIEHEVTGQLATPGDAAALARGLRRALDDAAAWRWAKHGAERVRERSEPAKHLSGLISIYEEAAS